MSKKQEMEPASEGGVRTYKAPWKGELVLACSKCQRKLKGGGAEKPLRNLRKTLKKIGKSDGEGVRLRVVATGCLKLCPKGGVAVTTESLLRGEPGRVALLRTGEDARALFRELRSLRGESEAGQGWPSAGPSRQSADGVVSEAGIEPATVSLEG